MRQKTIILILLYISSILCGQENFNLKNEKYLFTSQFIENNYLIINQDSLVFKFTSDTAIVNVDHVWNKNTEFTWILYENKGDFDFWLTYCKQFHYDNETCIKTPKKLITRYFKDNKIDLIDTELFSTAIKPQPINLCGNCYNSTDFLFKIKTNDLQKLKDISGQQFVIVKNNYL